MKALRTFFRNLALQRKLLVVSMLTTGAALLVALLTLTFYDLLVVRPRLAQDLASRMELLSLNLDVDLNFGDRNAAKRTLEALRSSPDVQSACLFDAIRQPFAYYTPSGKADCQWPKHINEEGHRFHGNALTLLTPVRYETETVGYLLVDHKLPPPGERLRQYGLVLAVVLVTLFSGSVLFALLIRQLVTQPLLGLYTVAEQVTREQRYDLRAPLTGQDEVGRLAQAFNDMLATVATHDAALRRSQSLLQNIVENSSAVIYVKDLDGRYLLLNSRYRAVLPPGSREPLGSTDADIFEPAIAQAVWRNDQEVRNSGKAAAFEEIVPDQSGEPRTYLSEKFPLFDQEGHMWALGGVSTDITERKKNEVELMQYRDRLEDLVGVRTRQIAEANRELGESLETIRRAQDELVRSEKLAALGSLVAGVAHELNTPIGNSLLAVSTLIDQTAAFNKACAEGVRRSALQAYVGDVQNGNQIVLRNLHRAVDLVASFKQVAVDRATSQRREFRLRDLTSEILLVLMPTFKKSGIRVHQEIPETIIMHSYPGPFGQVLINLVNNGLIHAFEGRSEGEIVITAREIEDDGVEITVRDNGVGIAPENMGRIYDPFFTTKLGRGGSGLGLNIVYNIVYGVLGGKIEVRSALGEGTSFVMSLPVKAA
jgi:signal transduction histidine kinase